MRRRTRRSTSAESRKLVERRRANARSKSMRPATARPTHEKRPDRGNRAWNRKADLAALRARTAAAESWRGRQPGGLLAELFDDGLRHNHTRVESLENLHGVY